MVVEGEEGRDVAVVVGKVSAAIEVNLIVLPDTRQCRRDAEDSRHLTRGDPDLPRPLLGRVASGILVQPIAVLNREMDLVLEFFEHGLEGRCVVAAAVPGSLGVAASELETEVKDTPRIQLGIAIRRRPGKSAEGPPRGFVFAARGHAVEVLCVRFETCNVDPARVVSRKLGVHGSRGLALGAR